VERNGWWPNLPNSFPGADTCLSFRFLISDLKAAGFVDLKVLEFWLVVGGKGGYEFALDDLYMEE